MTVHESIKLSKYAREKKAWKIQRIIYGICILLPLVLFAMVMNGSCTKIQAQTPAALISSSCQDTAGVYTPTLVSSFNAGSVIFNLAHFTRVCNEVYVSGSLSGTNAYDTSVSSLIQVSLPFASAPPFQEYGQALIGFNGMQQPTMGNIGFIHLVGATGATISWKPQVKNVYGLIYEFSYTIH